MKRLFRDTAPSTVGEKKKIKDRTLRFTCLRKTSQGAQKEQHERQEKKQESISQKSSEIFARIAIV